MRILFVADGRSPIALNWMAYFIQLGEEVHLVSTYPCQAPPGLASFRVLPVAFSGLKREGRFGGSGGGISKKGLWSASLGGLRLALRQWLAPLSLPAAARRLRGLLAEIQPDLVHAMRIPYEGMLTTLANPEAPFLLSVWGNDFTLHAPSTPFMRFLTRLSLRRADALHTDCQRDIRLAQTWGYSGTKPSVVLPGSGGVQLDLFYPPEGWEAGEEAIENEIKARTKTVINPRGFRAYVRNETFFRAIPLILESEPEARFLCPAMLPEPQAHEWAARLGIEEQVQLLPPQPREQMAALYRRARVMISPSEHDGTPNTLLEAMACGCLPLAGDIESLREWIAPGENGLLFDPRDEAALAQAVLQALGDDALYRRARQRNLQLIRQRGEYAAVMRQASAFYQRMISISS